MQGVRLDMSIGHIARQRGATIRNEERGNRARPQHFGKGGNAAEPGGNAPRELWNREWRFGSSGGN
jgi:hypothetical protein